MPMPLACAQGDRADVELDLERIIDDFVFLCVFVGNDFLPHMPSCFVDDLAIDNLLEIYRLMLPELGGYLTDAGSLEFRRVGRLVARFATLEDCRFRAEVRRQREAGLLAEDAAASDEGWRQVLSACSRGWIAWCKGCGEVRAGGTLWRGSTSRFLSSF